MTDSINKYDNLIGDGEFKTLIHVLLSGENVVRGEVLGYNTSTNKLETYDSSGSNGVNIPYGIAVADIDASAGDLNCSVYVFGEFKIIGLVFSNSGDSADQAFIRKAKTENLFIKDSATA